MRKNNDRGIKKRRYWKMIFLLTLSGCALVILAALLIADVLKVRKEESLVYARDREKVTELISIRPERTSPQWLFYQSRAGEADRVGEKENLDRLVNSWTKEQMTDDELSEHLKEYYSQKKVTLSSVAVQSRMLCLFPSANELPDYAAMLQEGEARYAFIGVYTQGDYDEQGRIMCYYWEVLVQ